MKHSCKKITRKKTRENTRNLGKFACKTLHTDYFNFLLEFLHRWLSECSCTCAGGFVTIIIKNQTSEAGSNVSILMISGLRVIQVF